MRTVLLWVLLLSCAAASRAGEDPGTDAMEERLRAAVREADGGFFDRARVSVNLLVHSAGIVSFGTVLSYSDKEVGRDNFAADSETVVREMRALVAGRANVAVVCLAWHYRKGVLTLLGGASYGTQSGQGKMDFSGGRETERHGTEIDGQEPPAGAPEQEPAHHP